MTRTPILTRIVLALVLLSPGVASAQPRKSADYPFPVPPVEIADRLAKADLGDMEPLTPTERKAMEAVWAARRDPKAKPLPQADTAAVVAHLVASGVTDPEAIDKYVAKFDKLVAQAEDAVAGAKTDHEKGELLFKFLHKGVLARGYECNQTCLQVVFDKGKYNCVSSAALYFLVGTRLGLELQPLLIASKGGIDGHAAVDLIDGKVRVQVEPTNPNGFDWQAKLKQPGFKVIGPQPNRNAAVDTDGFGLAASAAYNRGVDASKASPARRAEAIRCYVVALALNPADPESRNNMIAEFVNWGPKMADAGKYEEAVKVYAFATAVLGKEGGIDRNHEAIWSRYATAEFADGRFAEALKVLDRAAKAMPSVKAFRDAGPWVARAAQGLLTKGKHDEALDLLATGLDREPKNTAILDGLAYYLQESLKQIDEKKGTAAAVAHFNRVAEKFPKVDVVRQVGLSHARRSVVRLADAKKFDDAVKAVEAYKDMAGNKAEEVTAQVYDVWGRYLTGEKKFEDAVKKYSEGLKAAPGNAILMNNSAVAVDKWAAGAVAKKDWAEAVRIYETGLETFPNSKYLKDKKAFYEQRMGK